MLKPVNDFKSQLTTTLTCLVLLSRCVGNLKPFRVNINRSRTRQANSRDIINILLASISRSVPYVTALVFPLRFMARALRAWAINRWGKNSVRNLQYGPRTRLVRGRYPLFFVTHSVFLVPRLFTSYTENPVCVNGLCKWKAKMPDVKFRSDLPFTQKAQFDNPARD